METIGCMASTPPWTAIDDEERLAVLRQYGVLDTVAESVYDRIADILRQGCEVEWAAVTLIDRHRQWFKARRGFDLTETPRAISFCSVCMQSNDLLIVDDALNDPRFRDNPLVTGEPRLRFYAGCPLFSWEGFGLGSVCVIGSEPRFLNQPQKELLRRAGGCVQAHLEMRRLELEGGRGEMDAARRRSFELLRMGAQRRIDLAWLALEETYRSISPVEAAHTEFAAMEAAPVRVRGEDRLCVR
jgi:GAF domain-containing protein